MTDRFGCPTFLNFGRNYGGAPDECVYLCSFDGPSAYVADDAVVLARVPKGRIRDQSAYQFFRGLDAAGHRTWTDDSAARGPILSRPDGCERIDVVYHPDLGRYLIALRFNHAGSGGLNDTLGYRLPSK